MVCSAIFFRRVVRLMPSSSDEGEVIASGLSLHERGSGGSVVSPPHRTKSCGISNPLYSETAPDSSGLQGMLPGKARRELRRKLRKAGPYSGVEHYIAGTEHDLDEEIDAFFDLLIKSHPEKADFMDKRNRDFFHAIGQATSRAGYLQLAFLTVEGRRVASYMNFRYGDRIMVYNSGLDPGYYRLSPGIILMAHLIRHAIEEQRFQIFDFLRGDEPYKYALGGKELGQKVFEIRCGRCHEFGGYNDNRESLVGLDEDEYNDIFDNGEDYGEGMPDFTGGAAEREALIEYLLSLEEGGGQ